MEASYTRRAPARRRQTPPEGTTQMHAALLNAVAAVAPFAEPLPTASAPSWLKIGAIVGLIVAVVGIVLMVFGLGLTARAKKGDLKGAARSSGVAGIGLMWI